MNKFKVYVRNFGKNEIKIVDEVNGISKKIRADAKLSDITKEVDSVLLQAMSSYPKYETFYDGVSPEHAMDVLGYEIGILDDECVTIDGKTTSLRTFIGLLETGAYQELLKTGDFISCPDSHKEVVMNVCVLYKINNIAKFILSRCIINQLFPNIMAELFDKTYLAAAISDNIEFFKTLLDFSVPPKDMDKYLIEATRNNSIDIVIFILLHRDTSSIAKHIALKEAVKNNNATISELLVFHGAELSFCDTDE